MFKKRQKRTYTEATTKDKEESADETPDVDIRNLEPATKRSKIGQASTAVQDSISKSFVTKELHDLTTVHEAPKLSEAERHLPKEKDCLDTALENQAL